MLIIGLWLLRQQPIILLEGDEGAEVNQFPGDSNLRQQPFSGRSGSLFSQSIPETKVPKI